MSEKAAFVLHTFWPLTTNRSPSWIAVVRMPARSLPGVGLAEQLAPHVLVAADPRQVLGLLGVGAEVQQGVAGEAARADRDRCPRLGELLGDEELLDGLVVGAAAELLGPVGAVEAGGVELGAPVAEDLRLVLVLGGARAHPVR